MHSTHTNAPPPDLRIVRVDSLHPHEEHDSQRAQPLIEKLRQAEVMINPPVVAPMGASQFVVLDGANRSYCFATLEYPHILVQVAAYDSGYVELHTWNHVVSQWQSDAFMAQLRAMPELEILEGQHAKSLAHVIFREGQILSLCSAVENTHEKNAVLRKIVQVYQSAARLNRTAISEPGEIWLLYPDAIALVVFARYLPADIIAAARYKAYLPPGISRHVIHGRALRVNYPLAILREPHIRLSKKNEDLHIWLQHKLAQRQVRYYAEATYQFDE